MPEVEASLSAFSMTVAWVKRELRRNERVA